MNIGYNNLGLFFILQYWLVILYENLNETETFDAFFCKTKRKPSFSGIHFVVVVVDVE